MYQLDDVVNKILPGPQHLPARVLCHADRCALLGALSSVDATGEQAVKPGHVFFTASGRIGAILEMNDAVALHMTALQRNMAKTLVGPGDVNQIQCV